MRERIVTSAPVIWVLSDMVTAAWLSIAEIAPVKAIPTDCAVAVVVDSVTASEVTFTSPLVAVKLAPSLNVTADFEVVTETDTSAGNKLARLAQPSLDKSVFTSDFDPMIIF